MFSIFLRGSKIGFLIGFPLHRKNRKNGQKQIPVRKNWEYGNFVKTQAILYAQVLNSIVIFAAEFSYFFLELEQIPGRENWEYGNFVKTQAILYAQVLNSIVIFAAEFSNFVLELESDCACHISFRYE